MGGANAKKKQSSLAATRALVLAPTRELAAQCVSMMTAMAKFTDLRAALIVGGAKNVMSQVSKTPFVFGRCLQMGICLNERKYNYTRFTYCHREMIFITYDLCLCHWEPRIKVEPSYYRKRPAKTFTWNCMGRVEYS